MIVMAKLKTCDFCGRGYHDIKCRNCLFISATEEVDERFKRMCELLYSQNLELLSKKKEAVNKSE